MFEVSISNNQVNMQLTEGESVAEAVGVSMNGAPVNLTGYTVKMTISFIAPKLLSTGNGGITLTAPTSGTCQINITAAESTTFTPGSFAYDFWIISDAGFATRLFTGTFTVLKSITEIP